MMKSQRVGQAKIGTRIVKFLPLILGLLLLGYSGYVYYAVSGLKLFELSTRLGAFYVATYKYAAILGVLSILLFVLIINLKKFRSKMKHK